jgi:hypothetical protein
MSQQITDFFENGNFIKRVIKTRPDNKTFRCSSCGYLWETRKKIGVPPKCPKCNSKQFEECSLETQKGGKNSIFECGECRHIWGLSEGDKDRCPKCNCKNVLSYKDEEDFILKEKERKTGKNIFPS